MSDALDRYIIYIYDKYINIANPNRLDKINNILQLTQYNTCTIDNKNEYNVKIEKILYKFILSKKITLYNSDILNIDKNAVYNGSLSKNILSKIFTVGCGVKELDIYIKDDMIVVFIDVNDSYNYIIVKNEKKCFLKKSMQ